MLSRRSFLRFIPAALALPFLVKGERVEAAPYTEIIVGAPDDRIWDEAKPWRSIQSNTTDTIDILRPFRVATDNTAYTYIFRRAEWFPDLEANT